VRNAVLLGLPINSLSYKSEVQIIGLEFTPSLQTIDTLQRTGNTTEQETGGNAPKS